MIKNSLLALLTTLSVQACAGAEGAPVSAASSAGAGAPAASTANRVEVGIDAIPLEMRPARIVDDLMPQLLAPDVANKGTAMFTEVLTIPPGADVTYCTYTPVIATERIYMRGTHGVQSRFGHHVLLQYVPTPIAPTTHECPPSSLEAQQGGTIIGGTGKEGFADLPANVVSEVPAGAQFMITHHWINTSEAPVEVQAEVVTVPVDSTIDVKDLIIARSLVLNATDFVIPPHSPGQGFVECAFDREVKLISALGHAHEWGTHVKVERSGSVNEIILDHPYQYEYVVHPRVTYFPVANPYVVHAGDRLRLTCQWMNTEDEALQFPSEMCAFQAWQIGAERDAICISGTWITQ